MSVILRLMGPGRLDPEPPGGRNPKPGGRGPGKPPRPPRPPRLGGKPRLGIGGPNPIGLARAGWCLLSGSGVLFVKPFSL